jgi:hypothetical protein
MTSIHPNNPRPQPLTASSSPSDTHSSLAASPPENRWLHTAGASTRQSPEAGRLSVSSGGRSPLPIDSIAPAAPMTAFGQFSPTNTRWAATLNSSLRLQAVLSGSPGSVVSNESGTSSHAQPAVSGSDAIQTLNDAHSVRSPTPRPMPLAASNGSVNAASNLSSPPSLSPAQALFGNILGLGNLQDTHVSAFTDNLTPSTQNASPQLVDTIAINALGLSRHQTTSLVAAAQNTLNVLMQRNIHGALRSVAEQQLMDADFIAEAYQEHRMAFTILQNACRDHALDRHDAELIDTAYGMCIKQCSLLHCALEEARLVLENYIPQGIQPSMALAHDTQLNTVDQLCRMLKATEECIQTYAQLRRNII